MNISKSGLAGVAAAALLMLAACGTSGGSGENSTSDSPASTSVEASSTQPPSSTNASSSKESPSSESSTAAETVSITIKDFKYQMPKSIAPGAKIKVTNEDSATHTITADKGDAFDVNVPGKGSATFTAPSKPGETAFHCTFHANMKSTLVVTK